MLFSEVIGHEKTKDDLVQMVASDRLSHAILLLAPEGSGGLSLALAFANYILCLPSSQQSGGLFGEAVPPPQLPQSFIAADEWMQKQPAYQKASAAIHPDLHYSYPVVPRKSGDKPLSTDYIEEWREFIKTYPYGNVYDWLQVIGAENKQGNITAAECNDITRKLSLKTFEAEYKVLVLWMAEYLGKEGNKLLKLIEEPPPGTVFLLVAENEAALLPTIISRCQVIRLPPLTTTAVTDALVKRSGMTQQGAEVLAAASGGNYREALHLLQHSDEDFNALLREWLNATVRGNPFAQQKAVDDLARLGREPQKQVLKLFLHLIELALRSWALPSSMSSAGGTETDFAARLNKVMTPERLAAASEELEKAIYYVERNANGKMLFTALTIKLRHIIKNGVVPQVQ